MPKYYVPINEAAEGESQTVHIVDTGDVSERVSKKKLRTYFAVQGVPNNKIKTVMKKMGFL